MSEVPETEKPTGLKVQGALESTCKGRHYHPKPAKAKGWQDTERYNAPPLDSEASAKEENGETDIGSQVALPGVDRSPGSLKA